MSALPHTLAPARGRAATPARGRAPEALALLVAFCGAGLVAFGPLLSAHGSLAIAVLLLPFVAWAALRFGALGAAAVSFLLLAFALAATALGFGPFAAAPAGSIGFVLYLCAAAITGPVTAAATRHRRVPANAETPRAPADPSAAPVYDDQTTRNFAAVLGQTDDIVYITDRADRIVYVNPSFERVTGYSAAEAIGKTSRLLNSGEHGEAFYRALWTTVLDGRSFSSVIVNRRKSGEHYHEAKTISPVRDRNGEITHFVCTGRDVTERLRADARVKRLARARTVMAACNRALVHASDERRMLHDMCEAAVKAGGFRMAWVGLARHDPLETIEPVARAGFESDYLDRIRLSWADNEFGQGPSGLAVRTGKPQTVRDVRSDPRFGRWREAAAAHGFRACATLPLVHEGETLGVFGIFSHEAWVFDDEELALLQELSDDIAFGIKSLRARQERKHAEEALRESEERNRTLLQASPDGLWMHCGGRIEYVNDALVRMFGYDSPRDFIGRDIAEFFAPEERPPLRERAKQLMATFAPTPLVETVMLRRDGSRMEVETTASALRHRDAVRTIAMFRDITPRKQTQRSLRESEAIFREFAENTPEVFWLRDADSMRMLYVSPGWERITQCPAPRTREEFLRIVHPDDYDRIAHDMRLHPNGGIDHEYRLVRPDGWMRWVRVQTFPIHDGDGRVYRIAGIVEDISERKDAEQRLLQMAHYDSLTRLPNRTLFYESLRRALEHESDEQWIVGVLFIDLDRFKIVNDNLGHATGDALLQQVAARLLECVRVRDIVGRLGGDEFAMILPGLESTDDAGAVANKVIAALVQPFDLEGREIFVNASIGITIYPFDETNPDALLRFADSAMYRAKDEGRNTYRYYTSDMNQRAREKLELENNLRRALERGEFLLHYQPKLDLRTREVSGVEALIRWERPDAGLVAPADFVPLLEETGLIVPVGEWVIGEACRQIKEWARNGLGRIEVAVNLSARQFSQRNLAAMIAQTLRAHDIDPGLLELELTETSIMSHADQTVRILEELKELGVRLSVDDFGTGYSSLGYLKRFPIDALKIDRAFVRDLAFDPDDAAITLAVIGMARALGLTVVAENVETAEQLAFLDANGCDEIQGFVFSGPLPAAGLERLLRERPWKRNRPMRRLARAASTRRSPSRRAKRRN